MLVMLISAYPLLKLARINSSIYKSLSKTEIIEEKAKRPYQQILLGIAGGIIAILTFILLEVLFG